jgi:predicted nucleic acid-binding protein
MTLHGMNERLLVLDANILIRAVLGRRVRELIIGHAGFVQFFAAEAAYEEARRHLPALLAKRGIDPTAAMTVLDALQSVVQALDHEVYAGFREEALGRIAMRGENDWPTLASALALRCPIWTEDADFFGTGVATWTTDRVKYYLS